MGLAQFENNLVKYYPETAEWVSDPHKYYERVIGQCNYLEAVKLIPWDKYLSPGAVVLDLAGGSGWLSAYLSSYSAVSKIYLLDTSKYFLHTVMPVIVRLMRGNAAKITAIEALFAPLFFEDNSMDMVVISSSLHHADNMEDLLKEIKRVLKPGGFMFILNETPADDLRYLVRITKQFVKIFLNTLTHKYVSISPAISSSGFLYDPYLQDRDYPVWYWVEAIKRSGFDLISVLDTGLATLKNEKKGTKLKHFICKK